MAKSNKTKLGNGLWDGITEDDFESTDNVLDVDLTEYNLEKWGIFSANVNYFRQFPRLSDSLKPIERRILYSALKINATPRGSKVKSAGLTAKTMEISPHGDLSIYQTAVGMVQEWKRAVPLLTGVGTFGNCTSDMYSAARYTDVVLSEYAYECFFQDFDPDCVEMILNSTSNKMEPVSLPAKFPNILVNGGIGMAPGNSFRIPPYNINDIVDVTKKLLRNTNYSNIFMIPDFPTGCDIVDDGHTIQEICDTGKGTLKSRAVIEIVDEGKEWSLRIYAIPWFTSLEAITTKIIELTKKNLLPIKDICSYSTPVYGAKGRVLMRMDHRIIIDKNQDPYAIREKLYKMTDLESSMPMNFKLVTEDLHMGKFNLKSLILSWIDERRSYKRRLYNKRLTKISARISLLDVFIRLLEKDNINKTVSIVRHADADYVVKQLMELGGMSSYQAAKIAESKLNMFTNDARPKYIAEKEKLLLEKEYIMDIITSEEKIDQIISDELDDLKKYATPRRCKLISLDSHRVISNTDHILVTTKQGYIKKLADKNKGAMPSTFGAFRDFDYPSHLLHANNLHNVLLFDTYGRFTNIPVNQIDNTEPANPGAKVYDYTKLNGEIVSMLPTFETAQKEFLKDKYGKRLYLVTLTKNGFIKKTDISEYTELKNTRNVRAAKIRDDDQLVYADLLMDDVKFMVYTKNGYYSFLNLDQVSEQSKDSMGIIGIKLKDMDECIGLSVIGPKDKNIVIVTTKGNVKTCEIEFFGDISKRGSVSTYLTTLDRGDHLVYADGMSKKSSLLVCTRTGSYEYPLEQIPVLTRKAKAQKLIPVPLGSNIISAAISRPVK